MEDTLLRTRSTYPKTLLRRGTDWGAIWAGVFVFAAIWTVFESLAYAIFGGASNLANPQSNMGTGLALWSIVLTIIAMYVAGHETSRLAGFVTRHDGLIHGVIMFGLSVVGAVALAALAEAGAAAGGLKVAGTHTSYLASLGAERTAFVSLLLGWLAAMWGASNAVKRDVVKSRQPDQVQPAA
jgi:hypothetical protein